MSDETFTATKEMDALLNRFHEAQQALMRAISEAAPDQFKKAKKEDGSAKRILERSADEVNFYYGRLVAQALSLPQPPGMETASFQSLEEAKISLQVAHKRFSNLLHNLTAEDLERKARLEGTTEYTLR
ncbi:MAG: hypothetical protein IIA23_05110, partial [Chloroflexi bacterium]|nr:hypothetical protein [Chloroflexota bacterium]